jgi:glycosyltransferase involved in cell wall biosynthesis
MRLAVVTQLLAPYRLGLFEAYRRRVDALRVFLMAERHSDRSWAVGSHAFESEVLPGFHVALPGYPLRGLAERVHVNVGTATALSRFRPDVVMTGGFSVAHFAAYRYCRRAGIRHVSWGELTLKDGAHRSRLKRWLRRTMIGGSSGCVASSSVSREAFLAYGAPPERILTSLMPVDIAVFRAAATMTPRGEGRPVVLSVGRLIPGKGFYELLEAFRLLRRDVPDAVLRIAGDGAERERLESAAAALGLRECVEFLGFVQPDALAQLYRESSVFAFSSLHDTFAAVIPEAMAAGAIVVASVHAAATHDLIDDGVTGFRIQPEQPAQSAAVLRHALGLEPAARDRIVAAAARAVERLDAERSAEETIRFLEALR